MNLSDTEVTNLTFARYTASAVHSYSSPAHELPGEDGWMLFEHFDRIRIVNLAHRKDRRRQMNRQLAKVGLHDDPRVSFFPAQVFKDAGAFRGRGERGCFMSHFNIIVEAALAGQSVLILEDDCDFLAGVTDYQMPEQWDVLYGGYVASDPDDPHDSDIIGAHFMGFSHHAAKLASNYLARYLLPDFEPDPRAASEAGFNAARRPGVDGAYVWFRRAYPELLTVFAMLSVQRASRTDIGVQRLFDRLPVAREIAGIARKVKRRSSQAGHVFQ